MKRQHERFAPARRLCVSFSTKITPNLLRLAEIVDVSEGGLAMVYKSRHECTK